MVCSDQGDTEISISEVTDGADPSVYEVLSKPIRRVALAVLTQKNEPISLTDLAEELVRRDAGLEAGGCTAETDWDAIERTRIALYHSHVPKLEDAGLVEFDGLQKSVRLAPTARS